MLVDNGAHINRLIERIAETKGLHACLQAAQEILGYGLLYQEPCSRTADLALIEPDRIDHALYRAVKMGIGKYNER